MGESRMGSKPWVRPLASCMTVSISAALLGLFGAGSAGAQVAAATAQYSGYSSGIDVHTGALTSGTTTLAEVDQAFSGAAVNTGGLGGAIPDNDLKSAPAIQVAAPGAMSGARGSGVEVGVAPPGSPLTNQIILSQEAFATAPPDSSADHSIPLNLNPVLSADLLEGKAQAHWATGGCILGGPISAGEGDATNLQVVGGPTAPLVSSPAAAHSYSNLFLVPQVNQAGAQVGNAVGIMAQVTETVAPVVIGSGLTAVTITVVGPWRMQAVATGVAGASYMNFGPVDPGVQAGTTPALTIQTAAGAIAGTPPTAITFQQILGANGLKINLPGLLNLNIAAPPHAIGDPTAPAVVSADGTHVEGASDIVQVTAGVGTLNIADVRVGHMIASATAPAGGIICPVPVTKSANPPSVNPGDTLTYSIVVNNSYNCTLQNVSVTDATTGSSGVRFTVTGASNGGAISGSTVNWANIGNLSPGASATLTITVKVASNSRGGTLTDNVTAKATCGLGNAAGTATVSIGLNGGVTLVTNVGGPSGAIPVTGGLTGRYYAVALLIGLAAIAFGRKGFEALFGTKA